jgi:hypothetical protein
VPRLIVDRQREQQRTHEMRGDLAERRTFVGPLEHQLELIMLEVAKPAVDQLRGAARCTKGQVALFDDQHPQATQRGVVRDPRTVDAATDDQEIEGRVVELRE